MSRLGAVGLAICLSLTGCGTPGPDDRPRYHTVRRGETIWRISQNYGTTVDEIVHANGIRDVNDVRVGTRLFIPPSRGYVRRDDANSYNGSHSKGKSGSRGINSRALARSSPKRNAKLRLLSDRLVPRKPV